VDCPGLRVCRWLDTVVEAVTGGPHRQVVDFDAAQVAFDGGEVFAAFHHGLSGLQTPKVVR
jgi:hypothetical protein